MKRVGSDDAGYSVETGALGVRVRAWGFWDASLAAGFAKAVVEALDQSTVRSQLLVDAIALKPQRDEGQEAFRAMIRDTAKLGLPRAELLVTNAITKMQLGRILREAGARVWTMTTPMSSPAGGET
jgi:hypothetical protein